MTSRDSHATHEGELLKLRNELEELSRISSDSRRPVTLDQTAVGRLSRMDALQMQSMAQAAERNREQRKRQIEAALRRVETGDYGFCVRCGEEIDARRLTLDPAVAVCIACADGGGATPGT